MGFGVGYRQVRRHALPAVQTQDLVVKAGGKVAVEDDQGFVRNLFQPKEPAFRQAVRSGQDDDKFLFEE